MKRIKPLLGRMIRKIAPEMNATVLIEPEWKIVGQVIFKNGKRTYFRYNTLDLNTVGAAEIAKDKDYSYFFMKKMGYPVIPKSKTFYSETWGRTIGAPERNIDAAYAYAQKIGFPVVVKPNSGSQGRGVSIVYDKRSFYAAMQAIFKEERIALVVQQPVRGKDYRVVVLDDHIVATYERMPLSIVGDGKHTVIQLIELKQQELNRQKRNIKISNDDKRMLTKLRRQKLSLQSVPLQGVRIYLLDSANLSTGGDSVDVTEYVHPEFKKIAIQLTKDMGLRLCGVDFMVNGDISQKPDKYWIIEINATPGFDHYAAMGRRQEKVIENLYREILKIIERS